MWAVGTTAMEQPQKSGRRAESAGSRYPPSRGRPRRRHRHRQEGDAQHRVAHARALAPLTRSKQQSVGLTLSRAASQPGARRIARVAMRSTRLPLKHGHPIYDQAAPRALLSLRSPPASPPVTTTAIHTTRTTPEHRPPPSPHPPRPAQPSSTESAKGPPRPLLHGGERLVALPHLSCVSASRPLPFPLQGSSTRCRHHRA
ncbi:hypothetical protein B0J12DRAFT_345183 [Macrophomina phaseolina]|uniref:Uncharacterized protein n=1 Tax=Macrophomina phaseolina TaxID=35725 RepID=A0ABQ8GMD1_9PEZI|nr:hypothetical protein B0J12DRAFT_345183 [Macrophomina phaseolina]